MTAVIEVVYVYSTYAPREHRMLELDTDSVDKMSIVGECLRARNL